MICGTIACWQSLSAELVHYCEEVDSVENALLLAWEAR